MPKQRLDLTLPCELWGDHLEPQSVPEDIKMLSEAAQCDHLEPQSDPEDAKMPSEAAQSHLKMAFGDPRGKGRQRTLWNWD